MKGEAQIIERLDEAPFPELGAVNQYWVHCRLLEDRGYRKLTRKERAGLGDYVTMKLFEDLMADEEGHNDFLEKQIDLFNAIGEARYGQLNAEFADDDD